MLVDARGVEADVILASRRTELTARMLSRCPMTFLRYESRALVGRTEAHSTVDDTALVPLQRIDRRNACRVPKTSKQRRDRSIAGVSI